MRTLVFLLLLANLSLFGYIKLDSLGTGEGVRLSQQVQPDKIKLLTPQEVAALGPAKAASLADVCVEWGPLSDTDRNRALASLEPLDLSRLMTPEKSRGHRQLLGVSAAGRQSRRGRPAPRPAQGQRHQGRLGHRQRTATQCDLAGGVPRRRGCRAIDSHRCRRRADQRESSSRGRSRCSRRCWSCAIRRRRRWRA